MKTKKLGRLTIEPTRVVVGLSPFPWTSLADVKPPAGLWCWVTDGTSKPLPAIWINGRFSNSDTWEDFDNEIKWWMPIPEPSLPVNSKKQ